MNEHFLYALHAWAAGDIALAAQHTHQAAEQEPQHLVYAEAQLYLARVLAQGRQSVYVSPEGFSAFIRAGGNVGLYRETSAALRQMYTELGPAVALLDIGVGDGLALLPALTDNIRHIDLLEPSATLLAQTAAAVSQRGAIAQTHNITLETFVGQPDQQARHWDLAQATFSLQSTPPNERPALLRWLHQHVDRLLMVEFDVPNYVGGADPDDFLARRRVEYVVEHYLRGLAEYNHGTEEDRVVAQGFLMPVLFGYFDRSANRTNWEHPIQEWASLLQRAGFTAVAIRPVFDYWWAPARLLDAQSL